MPRALQTAEWRNLSLHGIALFELPLLTVLPPSSASSTPSPLCTCTARTRKYRYSDLGGAHTCNLTARRMSPWSTEGHVFRQSIRASCAAFRYRLGLLLLCVSSGSSVLPQQIMGNIPSPQHSSCSSANGAVSMRGLAVVLAPPAPAPAPPTRTACAAAHSSPSSRRID